MNFTTIILWMTILIIGVIAIILVKLHYRGEELEKDEKSILSKESIGSFISNNQNESNTQSLDSYSQHNQDNISINPTPQIEEDYDIYISPEVENNNYKNIEYESQNQILINYENKVEKTQESMNEYQVEIMAQDNEKHELKDLFTIDELIKESKRKDSEREKEAQQIRNDDDEELNELKESIRKRKENEEIDDALIEEILADEEIGKILAEEDDIETIEEPATAEPQQPETTEPETIEEIINTEPQQPETIEEPEIIEPETAETETIEEPETIEPQEDSVQETLDVETIEDVITEEESIEPTSESEISSVATQKDIDEAISMASQEVEEEIEEISTNDNITDALLNSEESTSEEIKEPTLKSPTKISESNDTLKSPIDDSNLETEVENELDYRKDLDRIKNTITGSKLFQDVKERLKPEPQDEYDPIADLEEDYIRNVNDYEDEYAPIINETHDEFGETYEPDYDQVIREENTRRLMNNVTTRPEPEFAEPKISPIKSKPSRENIKIQLGNADVVLKKGDEIIFKHDGETYSSQVYAINGDDISVRYRRKDIIIKPEDVKKIY